MTFGSNPHAAPSTVLVTGGTGFVGRHLVRELARRNPQSTIRVLSRGGGRSGTLEPLPNVVYVTGDLVEPAAIAPHLTGVDAVFHLAALKGAPDPERPAALFRRVNVEATRELLDMSARAGASLFVFMSSTGVFGDNRVDRCTEEDRCVPSNVYERTKLEAEDVVRAYDKAPGLRRLILRPSDVFGEDHPQRHLLTLIRSVKRGRFGMLRGERAWVNYVYVRDVSSATVALASDPRAAGTFIINDMTSMTDFIDLIRKHLPDPGKVRRYPYFLLLLAAAILGAGTRISGRSFPLTVGKVRALANTRVFVAERLRKACPGYPAWGVEKGLKNTIDGYASQGWL